jgi:hypothetical protein
MDLILLLAAQCGKGNARVLRWESLASRAIPLPQDDYLNSETRVLAKSWLVGHPARPWGE